MVHLCVLYCYYVCIISSLPPKCLLRWSIVWNGDTRRCIFTSFNNGKIEAGKCQTRKLGIKKRYKASSWLLGTTRMDVTDKKHCLERPRLVIIAMSDVPPLPLPPLNCPSQVHCPSAHAPGRWLPSYLMASFHIPHTCVVFRFSRGPAFVFRLREVIGGVVCMASFHWPIYMIYDRHWPITMSGPMSGG